MRLQAVIEPAGGRTCLRDLETGLRFSRVVAGLCWPKGTVPGAAVALAEDLLPDPVDRIRTLRLADYASHADVERLLELASCLAPLASRDGADLDRSAVSVWVGNPWHPFRRLLRPANERLTVENRPRITLRPAPGVGAGGQLHADLAPHLARRCVGRQALVLGRRDLVAMVEDAGRDIRRPIEDFPAVAALLWAVAYCDARTVADGRPVGRPGAADTLAGY